MLSRSERFAVLSQISEYVRGNPHDWPTERQNLLLSTYGLPTLGNDPWGHQTLAESAVVLDNDTLVDFWATLTGRDQYETTSTGTRAGDGAQANWKPGMVRVFLSHASEHKALMGDVAEHLSRVGIHGFVAHDSLTVDATWSVQIEDSLASMQAFVAVVHPEFTGKEWCQQEVGWAFGRGVPRLLLRMGADIGGPAGTKQWPSAVKETAAQLSQRIGNFVASDPVLCEPLVDACIEALKDVVTYDSAGRLARQIAASVKHTDSQLDEIESIAFANNQVGGSRSATAAFAPVFETYGRVWMPDLPPF